MIGSTWILYHKNVLQNERVQVMEPGTYSFQGSEIRVSIETTDPAKIENPRCIHLSRQKVNFPIEIKTWEAG